jgi:hypothetical protein|tara:strand:- start:142 stop:255 length:114 start_codon:yes stop_codon:yes gene_type:complete
MITAKNILYKVSPAIKKQIAAAMINPPLMEIINFILA